MNHERQFLTDESFCLITLQMNIPSLYNLKFKTVRIETHPGIVCETSHYMFSFTNLCQDLPSHFLIFILNDDFEIAIQTLLKPNRWLWGKAMNLIELWCSTSCFPILEFYLLLYLGWGGVGGWGRFTLTWYTYMCLLLRCFISKFGIAIGGFSSETKVYFGVFWANYYKKHPICAKLGAFLLKKVFFMGG